MEWCYLPPIYEIDYHNLKSIPDGDYNRDNLFGDPLDGILKSIFINGIEYKHYSKIFIDKSINTIYQIDEIPEHLKLLDI